MTGPDETDDDAALAAEYVLHLLGREERQAFEARLRDEPALRALVRDWDEALIPMADEIAPAAPSPRLKERIEQRLFPAPAQQRGYSLRRLAGGIALAVAAALAIIVFLPDIARPPEGPALRAEIAAEDRSLLVNARFDPEAGTLAVERLAGAAPPGRVLELWLIADGADAPVSLGVLPEDGTGRLVLPGRLGDDLAGAVLAISEEPPGGSPTGAPTGAVLATGAVTVL